MRPETPSGPILFQYGFRPFFLLAAIGAPLLIAIWMLYYAGMLPLNLPLPGPWWHGHEMVFGFVSAAAAGFLLTATPNWTGATPLRGKPLMIMALAWVVGRLCGFSDATPLPWIAAAADLLFFLGFAIAIVQPLWKGGTANHRWPPVLMMSALLVADQLVHLEILELTTGTARIGLYLGMDVIIMLGIVIGARLVPRFTQMDFQSRGIPLEIKSRPRLEAANLLAMLLLIITDVIALDQPLNGAAALLAAIIYAIRLAGWHPFRYRVSALLLVLQIGYLWLVIGLALRGVTLLTDFIPIGTAIHALAIGAMGSLILGIMTRVSLAHTGRPPHPPGGVIIGFGLISLAALLRLLLVTVWPIDGILLAGAVWVIAFGLFLPFAWPKLTRPRADGVPG